MANQIFFLRPQAKNNQLSLVIMNENTGNNIHLLFVIFMIIYPAISTPQSYHVITQDSITAFSGISGISMTSNEYIFLTDATTRKLQRISVDGKTIETIVGPEYKDINGNTSVFQNLTGIRTSNDEIFISQQQHIFKLYQTPQKPVLETIITVDNGVASGFSIDGRTGDFFISDFSSNLIRRATKSYNYSITTLIQPSPKISSPFDIAVDKNGTLFIAEQMQCRILKVNYDIGGGSAVNVVAGGGGCESTDGRGTSAKFNYPAAITFDLEGSILIAEYNSIRSLNIVDYTVSTLAKFPGDFHPVAIDVDGSSGDLIVADKTKILRIIKCGVETMFNSNIQKCVCSQPGYIDKNGKCQLMQAPAKSGQLSADVLAFFIALPTFIVLLIIFLYLMSRYRYWENVLTMKPTEKRVPKTIVDQEKIIMSEPPLPSIKLKPATLSKSKLPGIETITVSSLKSNPLETSYFSMSTQMTLQGKTALAIPAFLITTPGVDFELKKHISSGGSANVFLASVINPVFSKYGDIIVIKEFTSVINQLTYDAFYQELSLMYLLKDSPFIAKVLGFSENPFTIAMKYYPRGSLYTYVHKCKPLLFPVRFKFMRDIASGLLFMMSKGVCHCDIKTMNVLLDEDPNNPKGFICVITDFGLSCLVDNQTLGVQCFKSVHLNGASLPYASAESIKRIRRQDVSQEYDPVTSDIYSFGIVMYELVNCQRPWFPVKLNEDEMRSIA